MNFLRRILALFGLYHQTFAEPERYIAREYLRCAAQSEELERQSDEIRERRERADLARARAITLLGPRHVLHSQYKCRAQTYEDFLQQPPGILNAWRALHVDPKQRTPASSTKPDKEPRKRLKSV